MKINTTFRKPNNTATTASVKRKSWLKNYFSWSHASEPNLEKMYLFKGNDYYQGGMKYVRYLSTLGLKPSIFCIVETLFVSSS